jgi:MoaA/NifB/PqqE/SkfB family radical SAM enzyme
MAGLIKDRTLAKNLSAPSADQRRWRLWQVESAIACNLRCIMCPWTGFRHDVRKGIMTGETWAMLRPYLSEVRSIDFTGGGEPLLQPHLIDWMAEAKSAGCEIGFLTNGLLLNRETARRTVDIGIDWIGFSVDGATKEVYENIRHGSNFNRICENIAAIDSLRVGKVPLTMINFVIMPSNRHQIEAVVELAVSLGIDQLNFKQCDVIRGVDGKGHGLFSADETRGIKQLKKHLGKARRLAGKLKINTTAFSFVPDEQPVCHQDPRDSLFVRYDGAVAPCINLAIGGPTTFLGESVAMPTIHYGRLGERRLKDLWNTDTCRFYRERFQQRVLAHDRKIVGSTFEASLIKLKETFEAARKAMPEAPEGCRVCHYLYDI